MSILEELKGQVLDEKYLIERKLGQGGMGAVYLAMHLGTCRPVALKVISPQYMAYAEFVERFRREAEAAGRLRHPNIVDVTDFGFAQIREQKLAYMVMEYLDGCSLGEVLGEGKQLPVKWVVEIIEQVCLAIDEAHRRGIIHRDLKPDNIWLEPDRRGGYNVKVLDFGLAKVADTAVCEMPAEGGGRRPAENCATLPPVAEDVATIIQPPSRSSLPLELQDETETNVHTPSNLSSSRGKLTQMGAIIGTPLYMSPEQCAGGVLDSRSDIYSLGVIVYHMLAGRTPFTGKIDELIRKHINEHPEDLRKWRSDLPKSAAELVMSALAKDPASRPQTAIGFAAALRSRTENTRSILRQSISMCNDHMNSFLKVTLIAWSPVVILGFLLSLIGLLTSLNKLPKVSGGIAILVLMLLYFVAIVFSAAVNGGVFIPILAQLIVTPLSPVKIKVPFSTLRKHIRPFLVTNLLFLAAVALMFIVFAAATGIAVGLTYFSYKTLFVTLPVLIAGAYIFCKYYVDWTLLIPVVMLEGVSSFKAFRRSKELVNRLRIRARRITLLQMALGIFFTMAQTLIVGVLEYYAWRLNLEIASNSLKAYGEFLGSILSIISIVLVSPFLWCSYGLVYLKARQAGGETLKDVLTAATPEALPSGSAWQSRISEYISQTS